MMIRQAAADAFPAGAKAPTRQTIRQRVRSTAQRLALDEMDERGIIRARETTRRLYGPNRPI